jgi:hypothetical protein
LDYPGADRSRLNSQRRIDLETVLLKHFSRGQARLLAIMTMREKSIDIKSEFAQKTLP